MLQNLRSLFYFVLKFSIHWWTVKSFKQFSLFKENGAISRIFWGCIGNSSSKNNNFSKLLLVKIKANITFHLRMYLSYSVSSICNNHVAFMLAKQNTKGKSFRVDKYVCVCIYIYMHMYAYIYAVDYISHVQDPQSCEYRDNNKPQY